MLISAFVTDGEKAAVRDGDGFGQRSGGIHGVNHTVEQDEFRAQWWKPKAR